MKESNKVMRTAIFLGALVIAASINSNFIHGGTDLLSVVLFIFIGVDIIDLCIKIKKG